MSSLLKASLKSEHALINADLSTVIVVLISGLLINFTQSTPDSTAWLQEDQSGYNCAYGNFVYTIVIV